MMEPEDYLKVALFLFCLVIAYGFGAGNVAVDWRNDCERVGKHLSNDKVYVCYLEVKKS